MMEEGGTILPQGATRTELIRTSEAIDVLSIRLPAVPTSGNCSGTRCAQLWVQCYEDGLNISLLTEAVRATTEEEDSRPLQQAGAFSIPFGTPPRPPSSLAETNEMPWLEGVGGDELPESPTSSSSVYHAALSSYTSTVGNGGPGGTEEETVVHLKAWLVLGDSIRFGTVDLEVEQWYRQLGLVGEQEDGAEGDATPPPPAAGGGDDINQEEAQVHWDDCRVFEPVFRWSTRNVPHDGSRCHLTLNPIGSPQSDFLCVMLDTGDRLKFVGEIATGGSNGSRGIDYTSTTTLCSVKHLGGAKWIALAESSTTAQRSELRLLNVSSSSPSPGPGDSSSSSLFASVSATVINSSIEGMPVLLEVLSESTFLIVTTVAVIVYRVQSTNWEFLNFAPFLFTDAHLFSGIPEWLKLRPNVDPVLFCLTNSHGAPPCSVKGILLFRPNDTVYEVQEEPNLSPTTATTAGGGGGGGPVVAPHFRLVSVCLNDKRNLPGALAFVRPAGQRGGGESSYVGVCSDGSTTWFTLHKNPKDQDNEEKEDASPFPSSSSSPSFISPLISTPQFHMPDVRGQITSFCQGSSSSTVSGGGNNNRHHHSVATERLHLATWAENQSCHSLQTLCRSVVLPGVEVSIPILTHQEVPSSPSSATSALQVTGLHLLGERQVLVTTQATEHSYWLRLEGGNGADGEDDLDFSVVDPSNDSVSGIDLGGLGEVVATNAHGAAVLHSTGAVTLLKGGRERGGVVVLRHPHDVEGGGVLSSPLLEAGGGGWTARTLVTHGSLNSDLLTALVFTGQSNSVHLYRAAGEQQALLATHTFSSTVLALQVLPPRYRSESVIVCLGDGEVVLLTAGSGSEQRRVLSSARTLGLGSPFDHCHHVASGEGDGVVVANKDGCLVYLGLPSSSSSASSESHQRIILGSEPVLALVATGGGSTGTLLAVCLDLTFVIILPVVGGNIPTLSLQAIPLVSPAPPGSLMRSTGVNPLRTLIPVPTRRVKGRNNEEEEAGDTFALVWWDAETASLSVVSSGVQLGKATSQKQQQFLPHWPRPSILRPPSRRVLQVQSLPPFVVWLEEEEEEEENVAPTCSSNSGGAPAAPSSPPHSYYLCLGNPLIGRLLDCKKLHGEGNSAAGGGGVFTTIVTSQENLTVTAVGSSIEQFALSVSPADNFTTRSNGGGHHLPEPSFSSPINPREGGVGGGGKLPLHRLWTRGDDLSGSYTLQHTSSIRQRKAPSADKIETSSTAAGATRSTKEAVARHKQKKVSKPHPCWTAAVTISQSKILVASSHCLALLDSSSSTTTFSEGSIAVNIISDSTSISSTTPPSGGKCRLSTLWPLLPTNAVTAAAAAHPSNRAGSMGAADRPAGTFNHTFPISVRISNTGLRASVTFSDDQVVHVDTHFSDDILQEVRDFRSGRRSVGEGTKEESSSNPAVLVVTAEGTRVELLTPTAA